MSAQLPPPKVDDKTINLTTANQLQVKATPIQFAALAADYTTSSTADLSSGSGVTIVAAGSSIEVRGSAVTSGDTLGDGVTFSIYRSIVSVPTQTTAPSGGDVAVYVSVNSVTVAALVEGVGFDFVDTGLVIGKTYYYYSTVSAITGGNATLKGTNTGKNQSTLIAENSA